MARKPKTRAPYLMVSAATWELARAGYLGGETLKQVAARLQIGEHNLRRKINESGWTKRALADARAAARAGDAGGAPRRSRTPRGSSPASEATSDGGDLPAAVLSRARAALTAGRGSEASALLKAMREYVIARQDVADAQAIIADSLLQWDKAQPDRAGEPAETLMMQTLHQLWSGQSLEDQLDRADPDGKVGLRGWMEANRPTAPSAAPGRRRP